MDKRIKKARLVSEKPNLAPRNSSFVVGTATTLADPEAGGEDWVDVDFDDEDENEDEDEDEAGDFDHEDSCPSISARPDGTNLALQ